MSHLGLLLLAVMEEEVRSPLPTPSLRQTRIHTLPSAIPAALHLGSILGALRNHRASPSVGPLQPSSRSKHLKLQHPHSYTDPGLVLIAPLLVAPMHGLVILQRALSIHAPPLLLRKHTNSRTHSHTHPHENEHTHYAHACAHRTQRTLHPPSHRNGLHVRLSASIEITTHA